MWMVSVEQQFKNEDLGVCQNYKVKLKKHLWSGLCAHVNYCSGSYSNPRSYLPAATFPWIYSTYVWQVMVYSQEGITTSYIGRLLL